MWFILLIYCSISLSLCQLYEVKDFCFFCIQAPRRVSGITSGSQEVFVRIMRRWNGVGQSELRFSWDPAQWLWTNHLLTLGLFLLEVWICLKIIVWFKNSIRCFFFCLPVKNIPSNFKWTPIQRKENMPIIPLNQTKPFHTWILCYSENHLWMETHHWKTNLVTSTFATLPLRTFMLGIFHC